MLANQHYLYAVHCGQLYRDRHRGQGNPFTTAGVATTISVFGHDNSVTGIVVPHVIADASRGVYRPFDHVVVHGMLTLDGRKCSTSQQHGIWLSDLRSTNLISPDELRYALAQAPLDAGTADVALRDLAADITQLRRWRHDAHLTAGDLYHAPEADLPRVLAAVAAQHAHLTPDRLDLTAARDILADWLRDAELPAGDWLLGLALLGEPLIPTLAQQAWA